MTDLMSRRNALGILSMFFPATAVAVGESIPETPPLWDKMLKWHSEDAILAEIGVMLTAGEPITLEVLNKRISRKKRRDWRNKKAAERRERHQDETLYRGPVWINEGLRELLLECVRPVKPGVRRGKRIVHIGSIPEQLWLADQTIAADSRLLIDLRRDMHDIMTAELVRVDNSISGRPDLRIHLWSRNQHWTQEQVDTAPELMRDRDRPDGELAGHPLYDLYQIQERLR